MANGDTETPAPAEPIQKGGAASAPGFDLLDVARQKNIRLDAALQDAIQRREEIRNKGRLGVAMMTAGSGPQAGQALQQRVDAMSQEPINDALRQAQMHDVAIKQAMQEGQLAAADYRMKQDFDPNDPAARAAVKLAEQQLPGFANLSQDVRDGMTTNTLERLHPLGKMIVDHAKTLAEAQAKGGEAAKSEAEARAKPIETSATAAKSYAEAAKARAEAALTTQKFTGQVAPGIVRTGEVAQSDKDDEEARTKLTATDNINNKASEVAALLGDKNMILDPKKRAQAIPKIKSMMLELKKEAAIRGLPQADISIFDSIISDPTKFSVSNVTGLSKAKDRLQAFQNMTNEDMATHLKVHGMADTTGKYNTKKPRLIKHSDGTVWELQANGNYRPREKSRTATR